MTAGGQGRPIYEIIVTAVGPLVEEFTEAGVWVFFHDNAPEELAEFALLHRADAPREPIAAGQLLEIDDQRFTITAVGDIANTNIRELGHLVLKANGANETELPGEVCIEALPLPQASIGTTVRVLHGASEVPNGSV
ncbi:MAG: PTS sorbitol transporter subunit IIA [Chloroflexi bacterium]|nr:MAG: PTS sorbitol transporter subunit IIA [Chloroflexota bacterium]